jgi:hypothetical protein
MKDQYIKYHLLAHMILAITSMRGEIPELLRLMCFYERPFDDIHQAIQMIGLVYQVQTDVSVN